MDFKLSKIEAHVQEEDLVKGELLLESGGIQQLFELEKHLWLAKIKDGNAIYETEIKITPSRVSALSCECVTFKSEGMCAHNVAVMLAVRKRLSEQKDQKPLSKKTSSSGQKKLTTRIILNNVDQDDLVQFVREYAQKNRNFAIALKARFASSVDGLDSRQKYRQLLDTTISAARKGDRSISKRGIQKINKVLRELDRQTTEAMGLRHYTVAFDIVRSIIEKMTPILRKLDDEALELHEHLAKAFKTLQDLSNAMIAPDLKRDMFKYALSESDKRVYRSQGLDHHFFAIASNVTTTEKEAAQLLEVMTTQQQKYQQEGFDPTAFLKQQYAILESIGQHEQSKELIEKHLHLPEVLISAVKTAIFTEDAKKAKKLALKGLDQQYHPNFQFQLEEILLEISQATRDNAAVVKFAEKRFLNTFKEKYFEILKEAYSGKKWSVTVDQLLSKLGNLPYSIEKPAAIAYVLAEEERFQALEKHLRESRSIDLLLRFGETLANRDRESIFEIYHLILSQYLLNHLGRVPSQKIRAVISHLHQLDLSAVAERLVQEFRDQYPERHSLMEELAWFR